MTGAADSHSPRVLCVAGSPRRHGNSEQLLDALMRGVRDAGGEPVLLRAAEANARPCRGCNSCSQTGECVIRDGMDEVYSAIDSADAIVISTPVFFATVPAVLKIVYDRMQPYWARRHVLGEPRPERKRPGALLIVGGGGDPFGTACAITPSRSIMNVLSVSVDALLECVGPDKAGDILEYPDVIARAEEIGREIVSAASLTD